MRYHLFEVVSHHNAYDAAKAAYVTTTLNNASFEAVSQRLFDMQSSFFNGATANQTRLQVADILYSITGQHFGVQRELWMAAFNSDDTEGAVSAEHTYGITKGKGAQLQLWLSRIQAVAKHV